MMKKIILIMGVSCLLMVIWLGSMYIKNSHEEEIDVVRQLYACKDTYIGDHVGVGKIIDLLEFVDYPRESMALQTDEEPYGLTVNYQVDSRAHYRFVNERGLEQNMALLFALIPNVDEITFYMYDAYSDVNEPDTAFFSVYGCRELFHERLDMQNFTMENISQAVSSLETFTTYYSQVSRLPDLPREENILQEKYQAIGEENELVTNSLLSWKIEGSEAFATEADEQLSLGEGSHWHDYIKKTIAFQIQEVRNFQNDTSAPYLFVIVEDQLIFHQKLQNSQEEREVIAMIQKYSS